VCLLIRHYSLIFSLLISFYFVFCNRDSLCLILYVRTNHVVSLYSFLFLFGIHECKTFLQCIPHGKQPCVLLCFQARIQRIKDLHLWDYSFVKKNYIYHSKHTQNLNCIKTQFSQTLYPIKIKKKIFISFISISLIGLMNFISKREYFPMIINLKETVINLKTREPVKKSEIYCDKKNG